MTAALPNREIRVGDCRALLRELPDESVNCVVTSPPYFGLRDYGVDGQIGLEATPEAFVAEMVGVFREARRALMKDGTLWLNLGDSFAQGGRGGIGAASTLESGAENQNESRKAQASRATFGYQHAPDRVLLAIPVNVGLVVRHLLHVREVCGVGAPPVAYLSVYSGRRHCRPSPYSRAVLADYERGRAAIDALEVATAP